MDLNKLVGDTNPEDLKKIIAILQAVVSLKDSDNEPETNDTKKSNIKTKSRQRPPIERTGHNQFLDMPEQNMHKEDTAFQKKVSKHPPVPRSRPFTPISVRCRICGEVEEVNPTLVESPDRYKCNSCSGSAG
ncbi:hypothetical protein EB118_19265 [bacterium]|nr:hypothetical protein [bacterium]NDC95149.1 hypothetical protein [bacterium]NDD84893.1 hypothetical protein [bacterium]NDG32203.1 hypothetical protein [bacterium]